ncbi:hypothetical protein [Streptomyces sp. NPDC002692]
MTTNVEATGAEIERLRVGDIAPGLAQLALTIAASLDGHEGATAKANAARELRTCLESLRKLAPIEGANDQLDELTKKRRKRRAHSA